MKKNHLFKLLGTSLIIMYSKNSSAQWTPLSLSTEQNLVQSFTICNDILFMGVNSKGIFVSTDNGLSWQLSNEGIAINKVTYLPSVVSCVDKVYAIINDASISRIYESGDYGKNWNLSTNSLSGVSKLFALGNNLYAASTNALYFKTNESSEWVKKSFPVQKLNGEVIALVKKGDILFASTTTEGLYLSSDNGETWKQSRNTGLLVDNGKICSLNYLVTNSNYLLGGTENGLFILYDGGESWKLMKKGVIRSLLADNSRIYIGLFDNTVFSSDDNGVSWKEVGLGLNIVPTTLAMSNNGLFAVNNGRGVYKYENAGISPIINPNQLSKEIRINVFPTIVNSSCSVSFNLENDNIVELCVFDVLGRKVYSQAPLQLGKGSQLMTMNADNLNNGAYFIHIKIGETNVTEKITVNK